MSLNPLNELKRRLEDDSTALPKRLCMAKNVVISHHFPTAPKESIVASWLESLAETEQLDGKALKDILAWCNAEDLTSELKSRLIQVASYYIQKNPVHENSIQTLLAFLENETIATQLTQQIDDYLNIVITLLEHLKQEENINATDVTRLMNNIIKYYRECKKKLEFIVKLLEGKNIETLFDFLNTECRSKLLEVCQNVLFPMSKKSFFTSFLQTLIRKDNIEELMAEKGDNIQSVLKIMTAYFAFPNGRTEKKQKFLSDFIDVFVSCFKQESQLIFAFYIMVTSSLNMSQNYLQPAMKMPPIIFEEHDEKIKRHLFLKLLEILLQNEVDISVRLTDTFGEKISKVEIKKNFTSFLQAVMLGQLKLEGKLDKSTLQIIKMALKLDPVLIEQKMDLILLPIMSTKKTTNITESYIEMLNYLLEILFKLSRGTTFINQILPNIKLCLEAGNTEQFELKQKIVEATESGSDVGKLKSKLITGSDIFPPECVEMYGKWTAELMFRQNKELLTLLQKDFEEHCLLMLEEGFVSPSIITLTEVLSAILSSFLRHSKMADHTVPKQIAEDFWVSFEKFENECVGKLGECVLKLNYNPQLSQAFLNLCLNVARLKLLNIKYSHTKLPIATNTSAVYDLSLLLPCLNSQQWIAFVERATETDAVLILNNLALTKSMALQLLKPSEFKEEIHATKSHLVKQMSNDSTILDVNGFSDVLFLDLDKIQARQVAKILVKMHQNDAETEIFKSAAVANNRTLINAIVIETIKGLTKSFENLESLVKGLNKNDFDFTQFVKTIEMKTYFEQISVKDEDISILSYINILKRIPLPYLEESYQLVVIFALLAAKKCCQKKVKKSIDQILLNLFELSPKYPDLYKMFPADFIFSFEDKTMINLLTLKIKTANDLFIIKSILESAVKKVKTDSEIVKKIVELLLSKQKRKRNDISSIEYFSDPVFQVTCIILPIIAKEKRAITSSAYRSILADLQEKLHKSVLDSFKNIDFGQNSSLFNETSGYIDGSMVVSESTLATLNAMAAFSLTLSKYCETTDAGEVKNLDCLWSGVEFFIRNAINTIQSPLAKTQHVDSSIQLLNVTLRHMKKLESHTIFSEKDKLFTQIWKAIVIRLKIVFGEEKKVVLDDLSVTLKFLCELISVECFVNHFMGDLSSFHDLKKPLEIQKEETKTTLTSHKVSRFIWPQILKANLLGPKCVALSKLLSKYCKDIRAWIYSNYEENDWRKRKLMDENQVVSVDVDDVICELLKIDLDVISEAVLAAKKVNLDYKLLDLIFATQHMVHGIICPLPSGNRDHQLVYNISWQSFFKLFEGCVGVMNALLMSREELLEDRWPNYMQCYRTLLRSLCARAAATQTQLDRDTQDTLAQLAHSLEKLTHQICKRKVHVTRIAAYTVADICNLIERSVPCKTTRQHLENSAAALLQAGEWCHCAGLLRRALAAGGHATLATIHTAYKRYHHYTGNA